MSTVNVNDRFPITLVDYGGVRERIRDGDIILFGGSGFLSGIIERESEGPFSHSGICCWWDGRLMLLQAETEGLQAVPLSSFVGEYQGRTDWWSLTDDARQACNVARVLWEAKSVLGRPYSFWKLAEVAAHDLLHTAAPGETRDPSSMFCSEFVAHCYRTGGMPLSAQNDVNTAPSDIAASGRFKYGGTIRHDPKLKPNDRSDQIRLHALGKRHGAVKPDEPAPR